MPLRRGAIASLEAKPFTSIVNVAQLRETFEGKNIFFNWWMNSDLKLINMLDWDGFGRDDSETKMKLKILVLSNEFTQIMLKAPFLKKEMFHSDFND